ncbi:MAG TPA: toll/interleukin-1 receptor domain-containing protein, partial [Candidatus Limnocylindrales bacterium]
MADIFISYSSEDGEVAKTLRAYLESEGYPCWMAPDDVKGPLTYPEQIMAAIEACRAMVVLVSEAANDSGHVANEVSAAFDSHKAILPIRVEDVQPARSLAYLLRLQQWVDAFPGPIDRHADELRESLAALLGAVSDQLPDASKKKPSLMRRLRKRSPSILAIAGVLIVIVLAAVAYGMFQVVNGLGRLQAGSTAAGQAGGAGVPKAVRADPSVKTGPGQLRWSLPIGNSFYHAPLVTDTAVYVGTDPDHSVRSVDVKTGEQKWAASLGGSVWVSPAIAGDTVLAVAEDKYLYALDRDSGNPKWKMKVDLPTSNTMPQLTEPAVASGIVAFGGTDGMLYAVDVATGKQLWKLMLGGRDMPPHARLADGVLLFASYNSSVGGIDPTTGALLWRTDLNGVFNGLPCGADGAAYFRTTTTIYALDLKTGTPRWSVDAGAWGGQDQLVLPSPAAGSGIVCYAGEGNSLVALDANSGKQLWTFEAKGPAAPPA